MFIFTVKDIVAGILLSLGLGLLLIGYVAKGLAEMAEKKKLASVRKTGMWCRMCGGACDLENCGMEQP